MAVYGAAGALMFDQRAMDVLRYARNLNAPLVWNEPSVGGFGYETPGMRAMAAGRAAEAPFHRRWCPAGCDRKCPHGPGLVTVPRPSIRTTCHGPHRTDPIQLRGADVQRMWIAIV